MTDAEAALVALLEAGQTTALDVTEGGALLVAETASGVPQLALLEAGRRTPLSALGEPVFGRFAGRVDDRRLVLSIDVGGNERHQLYLARLPISAPIGDLDALDPLAVEASAFHELGPVTADGWTVGFASNRRNHVDTDVFCADIRSGAVRSVAAWGGRLRIEALSPDGTLVAVGRPGAAARDERLTLVEVSSGRAEEVLVHEEPALVRAAAFLGPDRLLVESDVGRDWIGLFEVARRPGREWSARPVVTAEVDLSVYGHHSADAVLVVANAGGRSEAWLADGRTFKPGARLDQPADAVIAGGALPDPLVRGSGAGLEVIVSLSAPDLPAEVFRWREASGLERLTDSASRLSGLQLVHPEETTARAADGLEIPLFVYRPAGRADGRVVVYVHGGPESQSTTAFQPIVQALLTAGIGVVVPNVRGSTGYGRRYAAADDGRRRLDAVGDLAAVHDRLAPLGFDPTRAVLWGGSYGGYMVLAGLAFQPERWAAGVDIVGISDLVTFLENTSAYRRAQREREYGSLATDRDFLAAASPLRRVEAIRAPLFVLHGANDPRVPLSEAEQLVGALRQRGVPVELRVYPDEGHGLTKRANRLDAYPRVFDWLDRVVPPR